MYVALRNIGGMWVLIIHTQSSNIILVSTLEAKNDCFPMKNHFYL